jgi:hypothetical protein
MNQIEINAKAKLTSAFADEISGAKVLSHQECIELILGGIAKKDLQICGSRKRITHAGRVQGTR